MLTAELSRLIGYLSVDNNQMEAIEKLPGLGQVVRVRESGQNFCSMSPELSLSIVKYVRIAVWLPEEKTRWFCI